MEDEPRILHVSTAQSWRGGEQQVAYLLSQLRQQGIQQGLMAAQGGKLALWARQNKFELYEAGKKSSIPLKYARALARHYQKGRFNTVHAHDSHAHTACILAAQFYGLKAPIVLSRRVDFRVGQNWFSRYKYNHPQVKAILCVSQAIKKVMADCIRRPERLQTVYSGIDLEKFPSEVPGKLRREYNIDPGILLIGNVAALADHKDYPTFIDTIAILQSQAIKARFFAIGSGPLEKEIQNYARQKEVDLIFTGFRDDIPEILPELDILLFTSKMEGLGSTVLDAFAAGVPVVATAGGGIPELVKNEQTGFLVPVGAAESAARYVKALIKNPAMREKVRTNARKFVKNFSLENTARQTLRVYRQIRAGN